MEGDSAGDSAVKGDCAICGAGSADSLMDWDASCAVVRSAGVCFAVEEDGLLCLFGCFLRANT